MNITIGNDPGNKWALIVVDLQRGTLRQDTTPWTVDTILHNATRLARAFRRAENPVALVTVAGEPSSDTDRSMMSPDMITPDFAELPNELLPTHRDLNDDHEIQVVKHAWSGFADTGLRYELDHHHIKTVVVVGLATSVGVAATVLDARTLGYNVIVPVDGVANLAMMKAAKEQHQMTIDHTFPYLARTCVDGGLRYITTDDVIEALEAHTAAAAGR